MKKLVAVPCFNEEDNIDSCIESLLSLKNEKIDEFDILVVNDGSKDETSKKLNQFSNLITVISSKQNFGLSEVFNSILYFSKEENYDQLIIFDSDNQYPFEDIPKLFKKISTEELDIVIGSTKLICTGGIPPPNKFPDSCCVCACIVVVVIVGIGIA